MTRWRHEGGTTLIEVVIAMTILAAMSVIALQAFRLGTDSWSKVERRAEADQRLRVTRDLLARELALMESVTVKIDERKVTGFRGDPDRVWFYAAPDVTAAAPLAGMMRRVSLGVEPDKGLVLREGWPLIDGLMGFEPGVSIRVLDPRVSAMRVRYMAPPTKDVTVPHWIDEWDPLERLLNSVKVPGASATNAVLLPSAIELTFTVSEEHGPRIRQFLFPVRIGRYLL